MLLPCCLRGVARCAAARCPQRERRAVHCQENSPAQSPRSTPGAQVQLAVPLKPPLWVAWKSTRLRVGPWLPPLVRMSRAVAGLSQTPALTPRAAWVLVEAM